MAEKEMVCGILAWGDFIPTWTVFPGGESLWKPFWKAGCLTQMCNHTSGIPG